MATPGRTLRFVRGSSDHDATATHRFDTVDEQSVGTGEPKLKRLRIDGGSVVEVRLVELIRDLDEANEDNDKHYGLFVWPSALLLSRFIAREAEQLCRDKIVLELGCGTGLPGILAGLCGATKIYLTDRADAADVQLNAEANIKLNDLQGRAEFIPMAWGNMHISDDVIAIFKTVQVILAADCFYQSKDFEKVIATVALIFRCSASTCCRFFFTYQLRSINRSIAPLLSRWGLTAKSLDKTELLHKVDGVSSPDFDSVYLYEVRRA